MNVLFYGPLGTRKKYVVGAGETGNLRTIHLLNKPEYLDGLIGILSGESVSSQ